MHIFSFYLQAIFVVEGVMSCLLIDELVKDLESRLEKDIMQTIEKMKSANLEPWLMGHRIWSSDHRYFETLNWNEKGWVDSEITCNIDIEVEKTGQRVF